MNRIKLPIGIDDPPPVFLWTQHQIIIFTICMFLGMFAGRFYIFVGMIVGGFAAHFLRRYQASYPDGYLVHRLYRIGLIATKGRGALNPYIRRINP